MNAMSALCFKTIFYIFEGLIHSDQIKENFKKLMTDKRERDIEIERNAVFGEKKQVMLVSPCSLDNGIIQLSKEQLERVQQKWSELEGTKAFFVPASGSGSRMFGFLFDFLNSGEGSVESRTFFEHFQELALASLVPSNALMDKDIASKLALAHFLLDQDKLNLADLPKGLIPFHNYPSMVMTAFQEHVAQIERMNLGIDAIHFTVQEGMEGVIRENINQLKPAVSSQIFFSNQSKASDAICFNERKELAYDDGKLIRRPSGHGALLQNLNDVDADVICIKNVDNVQHGTRIDDTKEMWQTLLGVLAGFQEELKEVSASNDPSMIRDFCLKYQLCENNELSEGIAKLIERPTRVCGMVRNEGEPGGGPFWGKKDGIVSKQIVEKVQIHPSQRDIMEKSSHFNPVLIVASKRTISGERLDLTKFSDPEDCIVVEKDHNGQKVKYRELPGLWNGAMANWNTIFVEVSSAAFSPVKHVLNLLDAAHLPKEG